MLHALMRKKVEKLQEEKCKQRDEISKKGIGGNIRNQNAIP